jgi:hypothetical protein
MSNSQVTKRAVLPRDEVRQGKFAAVKDALAAMTVGEVVEWDKLESITELPRDTVRSLAIAAKKELLRDERMHFRTVEGVGVERIDDEKVAVEVVPIQRKRMRNQARRMVRTTESLDLQKLTTESRQSVLMHQSLAQVVYGASTEEKIRQLAGSKQETYLQPLTPAQAMKRLLGNDE